MGTRTIKASEPRIASFRKHHGSLGVMFSRVTPTAPLGSLDPCIFHVGYTVLCISLWFKGYTTSNWVALHPSKVSPSRQHFGDAFSRLLLPSYTLETCRWYSMWYPRGPMLRSPLPHLLCHKVGPLVWGAVVWIPSWDLWPSAYPSVVRWLRLCGQKRQIKTQGSCLFMPEGITGLSRADVG